MNKKYQWNEDTVEHFRFEHYNIREAMYLSAEDFIRRNCQLEDGDVVHEMTLDLLSKVFTI
jgi:hypothetical protein